MEHICTLKIIDVEVVQNILKFRVSSFHFYLKSVFKVKVEGISHGSYAKKNITKLCNY